jgi:hypothetical protein
MSEKPGTARALAAARAVALANSVACQDAVVVAAGSNVLVHLKPAPVVARVMIGTAVLHGDVERWLAGEVAVGRFWENAVWPSHPLMCLHRGLTNMRGSG